LFAAVELKLFFVDSGVGSDMFGESKSEMDNSEGLDIVIRFGVCVNEVDRAPPEAFGSVWGRCGSGSMDTVPFDRTNGLWWLFILKL
jgi:hypothetical protein